VERPSHPSAGVPTVELMRIRVIDAFTDRPFAGNPAAVCLLDGPDWPDAAWMQRVAAEMNLSETAFTIPDGDGWELRWFTPSTEVDLCGHATLATAHALRGDGLLKGVARFATRSGELTAEAADDGTITLDFPAATVTPIAVPAGVAQALGAPVVAAYGTGGLGDLVVELADEATVRGLAPDPTGVSRLPYRGGRGSDRRLRLRLALLRPGRRGRRGPGDGQRPHRAGAAVVVTLLPGRARRAAGVGADGAGPHPAGRRPRPADRHGRHSPGRDAPDRLIHGPPSGAGGSR